MKLTKLLASTAVGAAIAFGSVAAQAADLTVVSWGGAYTKSQVEAYHKPFIAKTGVNIRSEDYNGGIAEIKAQVEAGNVTWDIVDVELSDAIRACDEGLLETIDHSCILPHLEPAFRRRRLRWLGAVHLHTPRDTRVPRRQHISVASAYR